MNITSLVLHDVRKFLSIDPLSDVFDGELIPHIMASIGRLSQNGIGTPSILTDTTIWTDVIPQDVITNPEVFSMVPLYIMMSAKLIFDPPPPSAIPYYKTMLDETLWRLSNIQKN